MSGEREFRLFGSSLPFQVYRSVRDCTPFALIVNEPGDLDKPRPRSHDATSAKCSRSPSFVFENREATDVRLEKIL